MITKDSHLWHESLHCLGMQRDRSSGNRVNFPYLYGEDTGYRSPVTLPYRSKTFGPKSLLRITFALKSPNLRLVRLL